MVGGHRHGSCKPHPLEREEGSGHRAGISSWVSQTTTLLQREGSGHGVIKASYNAYKWCSKSHPGVIVNSCIPVNIVPLIHYSLVNNVSPQGILYPHSYQWMLYHIQYSVVNIVSHTRFTNEYCIPMRIPNIVSLIVSSCIYTMPNSLWMYNYFINV